jgi:hypothetical protein
VRDRAAPAWGLRPRATTLANGGVDDDDRGWRARRDSGEHHLFTLRALSTALRAAAAVIHARRSVDNGRVIHLDKPLLLDGDVTSASALDAA